jgi:hypothetical protein
MAKNRESQVKEGDVALLAKQKSTSIGKKRRDFG